MPGVVDLLGPSGPLAGVFARYEVRRGQLEMARAVEQALAERRILLCEAGTGIGKTLAYLLPAIESGLKVVISTATRALQEQIVQHDLPLIERALGGLPPVAIMKGLPNYLCLRRYHELLEEEEGRPAEAISTLGRWLSETRTGDISEVAGLAENDPLWSRVTSSSETRVGSTCRYFSECFITRMKRDAERARLVIVNHHLFFADLAVRGPHAGRVIPPYDAVIFDEAHQLEDIATHFFGVRVSATRVRALTRDTARAFAQPVMKALDVDPAPILRHLERTTDAFWDGLKAEVAPLEVRATLERDVWAGDMQTRWHELDSALEALQALAGGSAGRLAMQARGLLGPSNPRTLADGLEVVQRRAGQLRDDLAGIIDGGPGHVTWFEADAAKAAITSAPVDLSHVFRSAVFESIPAVVLTSATLATVGAVGQGQDEAAAFDYIRGRLGLADGDLEVACQMVPSPFDYRSNAILYTPDDLPSPRDPRFHGAVSERIRELIEITGGGAFVLTTSVRSLQVLRHELARLLAPRRVMAQGDAPKHALLHSFRDSGNAVLVATMSFWEGVDIPGMALRLVIMEKIPFAVPTDPLVRARALALEEAGRKPFVELHVPAAAITLKQGFGRLVRSHSDRGIVAILDPRIRKRSYGKRLLDALPPARRCEDLATVVSFWELAASRTSDVDPRQPS